MSENRPTELIALWILFEGTWQLFDIFDPSTPRFALSPAPEEHAVFEANRVGRQLVGGNCGITDYRIQRFPKRRW